MKELPLPDTNRKIVKERVRKPSGEETEKVKTSIFKTKWDINQDTIDKILKSEE